MIIDVDNRQAGKTTTLIMDSYFSGVPILTTNVTGEIILHIKHSRWV